MIIDSPNRSGTILAGDALRFAGYVRNNVGGDTVRYHWDFGDGRSSDIQNPGLVSFANPGKKVISLSVSAGLISTNWPTAKRIIEVIPNTNTVPDLAVIRLDVPSDLSINQAAQIEYAIQNLGDQSLSGPTWKDVLYLSRDPYWDSSDKLLASQYVTRSLPVGASYTNQLTIQLPPVEEGAYYLILSTDDAWAILEKHQLNNEFAVAIDLVVPRLTNGLPLVNRFTGNGDQRYFRIDIPAGQNLRLVLNDTDNQGVNELYVSFGAFLTL